MTGSSTATSEIPEMDGLPRREGASNRLAASTKRFRRERMWSGPPLESAKSSWLVEMNVSAKTGGLRR